VTFGAIRSVGVDEELPLGEFNIAAATVKAVLVIGLLLKPDPSVGQGLFAFLALLSELLVVAGFAVKAFEVVDEPFRSRDVALA